MSPASRSMVRRRSVPRAQSGWPRAGRWRCVGGLWRAWYVVLVAGANHARIAVVAVLAAGCRRAAFLTGLGQVAKAWVIRPTSSGRGAWWRRTERDSGGHAIGCQGDLAAGVRSAARLGCRRRGCPGRPRSPSLSQSVGAVCSRRSLRWVITTSPMHVGSWESLVTRDRGGRG